MRQEDDEPLAHAAAARALRNHAVDLEDLGVARGSRSIPWTRARFQTYSAFA